MWVSHVSSVLAFQPRPLSCSFTLKIAVQSGGVNKHSPSFTDEAFTIGYTIMYIARCGYPQTGRPR